jgi:hypothetical protein
MKEFIAKFGGCRSTSPLNRSRRLEWRQLDSSPQKRFEL